MKTKTSFSRNRIFTISLVILILMVAMPPVGIYGLPAPAVQVPQKAAVPLEATNLYEFAYIGSVDLQYAVAGLYSDTLTKPTGTLPRLGSIDLGFLVHCNGATMSGYVDLSTTLVFPDILPTDDGFGPAISSGTCSDDNNWQILSAEFSQAINQVTNESGVSEPGTTVKRQFRLTLNELDANTHTYKGEYRETLWNYGAQPTTIVGNFTLFRSDTNPQVPEYHAPTNIALSNNTVAENKAAGTVVGTLSTTDPDVGDAFTYSFCGGVDDVSFSITGDALKTAAVFDYESKSSYSICIRSTDQGGLSTTKTFMITVTVTNLTFSDVSDTYWAWQYIERLYDSGITGGCSTDPLSYCPTDSVTRAQMAVFLLKGINGAGFAPPAVGTSTGFADVDVNHWAAAWIKQLAAEAITGGCGSEIYCPETTVTRAQMAVFLLKAIHGSSYVPPNASTFGDTSGHWAEDWIEQLAAEGITSGCGNGNFCPENPVTRDQMAVFLVKAFNLP